MANNTNYVQLQKTTLVVPITASATSIQLSSLKLLADNTNTSTNLTIAMFGTTGYGTIDPGTSKEENISFTGITQNSDGTATLTGVTRGLQFVTPYTAASNYTFAHAGGSIFIITDNTPFLNTLANKSNDETITGQWTFNSFPITPSTPNASASVIGMTKLSISPVSSSNPIAVGDNDTRVPSADPTTLFAPLSISSNLSGVITPYGGRSAPTGWLLCDGTAVSRTTYSTLKGVIAPAITVTVTIASPGVFSATAHGLVVGDKISFTTTGALPTGLAVNTDYFVISAGLTANAFEVSASLGGAAVNTSGSQSGVHTLHMTNYGKGDGSTTFNLPDFRGMTPYGYKSSDANFNILNSPTTYVGEKTHTLTIAELASHNHESYRGGNSGGNPLSPSFTITAAGGAYTSGDAFIGGKGGDTAHNNMPPYVVTNFIIKT